jgi:MoxR-like ATPase
MERLPTIAERSQLFVKAGFGQGSWADMPWLIVADPREADGPRKGVICTFKFPYDMSGVYVTLNQGIDLVVREHGGSRPPAREQLRRTAEAVRPRASALAQQGFHLDSNIDLRTNRRNPQYDFEASTIAWKFYPADALPDDEQLNADFEALIRVYLDHIEHKESQPLRLDPDALEAMRRDFLAAMPGFESFTEAGERYRTHERDYKVVLVEAFQDEVAPLLAQPPRSEAEGQQACEALRRLLLQRKLPPWNAPQNLLNWRYAEHLGKLDGPEALTAARLMHDLLHGDGASSERIERFVQGYWNLLQRHGSGQALTRSLPTLLLMLADPQTEIFVRTSLFDEAAQRLLGHRLFETSQPMSAEDYTRVQRFGQAVWRALEDWGWAPQDMIDVQSFLWVTSGNKRDGGAAGTDLAAAIQDAFDLESGRRIYKIAPGENATFWSDCRDGGFICMGWDEVGDLRAFSDADVEHFPEYFRSAMGDRYVGSAAKQATGTRKAQELWTFRNLAPGDIVVANQGMQAILAIGEVVEPGYVFDPDRFEFKHIVHVRWDESYAKPVETILTANERASWGFTTLRELERETLRALVDGRPMASEAEPVEPEETDDYVAPPLDELVTLVQKAGLRLSARTIRRYRFALESRGFVILAGLSGTGKTWLAEEYARAVGAEFRLVAVAPNWTSDEDLLGFESPLTNEYQHTTLSRFLQEAARVDEAARRRGTTPRPYHFILDEMNLARVEHYFAKFLSAMEVRARRERATMDLSGRLTVTLPPNFSFVGTINVDETTHGLADKVFDRAQLLEIDVDQEAFERHTAGRAYQEDLLALQAILAETAPFAFRIADDVARYVDQAEVNEIDWREAFDEAVLQKILPKIRGTDPALQKALEDVAGHCHERFPLSAAKARRMLEAFASTGFASYF